MSMRPMFLILALIAASAQAATRAESDCKLLSGPTWKVMDAPPANAEALLALDHLRTDVPIVWLEDAKHRLTACAYAKCASTSAEFGLQDGQWTVRSHHTLMCSG